MTALRFSSPVRRAAIGAGALLAAAALAAPAGAAVPVVASGSGLTAPSAIAVAPDGGIWVADALLGVCKIANGAPVQDGVFCGPATTSGLGGAAGIAFKTSLAGTFLYVTDPSSKTSGVWRLPYNPDGTLSPGVKIVNAFDSRPQGVVINPAGDVEYTVKRDDNIRRIADPDVCAPCSSQVKASAGGPGSGLAYLGTALFLPGGAGITTIADLNAANPTPTPAPGFPGGMYSAVSTDPDADPALSRVYAATANPGTDAILVREGETTVQSYASGFAGVTALAVTPDGTLLVADDPAFAAGAVDSSGQGRIFAVEPHAANRPQVTITSAPASLVRIGDVAFTLAGPDGATFECSLDGGAFSACGSAPSATTRFQDLAEGPHTFRARAVLGTVIGEVTSYVVTVDSVAATVSIDTTQTAFVGRDVTIDFSANEPLVEWACSLDSSAFAPCAPPRRLTGLSYGDHVLAVRATDQAGNVSAPATHRFTTTAPPEPVVPDRGPSPDGSGSGSGPPPAPLAAAQEPGPAAPPVPSDPPVTGSSFEQPVVSPPCTAVAAPRTAPRFTPLARRRIVLNTTVPAKARYLKLTLRHRAGTTRGDLIELTARRVEAGPVKFTQMLTKSQFRRLRSGRYRLGVAFGTCPTTVGQPRVALLRAARGRA